MLSSWNAPLGTFALKSELAQCEIVGTKLRCATIAVPRSMQWLEQWPGAVPTMEDISQGSSIRNVFPLTLLPKVAMGLNCVAVDRTRLMAKARCRPRPKPVGFCLIILRCILRPLRINHPCGWQHLMGMVVYHLDDWTVWNLSCASRTIFRSDL